MKNTGKQTHQIARKENTEKSPDDFMYEGQFKGCKTNEQSAKTLIQVDSPDDL